jgi:LL-diaminopimelate aminotransferase
MGNNKINYMPSDRIAGFKPYFFAQLGLKINELKTKGVDIIRLDMGSPDLPPDMKIIERLRQEVLKPDVHAYSPNGGTKVFKEAVATYYLNRFGVELDPDSEVFTLIGSKEGLFALSQVLLNPGDVSLVPDPGYPVYSASGLIAGAEIVPMPLLESNQFLPDLEAIPQDILKKAKIIWVNYPNNPTGATAPVGFYKKLIEFAHQHNLLIAHDAPYADVSFDGYCAPSILQFEGAQEVTVEFNSLSKMYNMAGWRLGMAVGNAQVIKFLGTYKSQQDTAHFTPIMTAGMAALTGDQDWIKERNLIYQERRDLVVKSLIKAGIGVNNPKAAIYVWVKLSEYEKSSVNYCTRLLEETGVSTTPGIVFGKYGEGYLRISLCTSTPRISEAMERITRWSRKQG